MNNSTKLFSNKTDSTKVYRVRISFKSTIAPLAMVICLSIIRWQFGVLLFHTLAELFSVMVGILMLVIVWNTSRFTHNNFLIYLGIGYFWIAILDVGHTLTVNGLPFFNISDSEITLHFWIYTRIIEAVVLLSASLFLKRKLKASLIFYSGAILTMLVAWASFTLQKPVMLTPDGLTAFKVNIEYLIIILLCTSIFVYIRQRERLSRNVFFFLLVSLLLTAIAELFFTLYTDFQGIPFVIGHLFKFLSFWMIYQAIVQTTLNKPFSVLAEASGSYDAIPHPAVVVDSQAVISQINRAAERCCGKSTHELVHKQVHEFFHPSNVTLENCKICQAIKQGKSMENQIVWFPEKEQWFLVSLAPIKVREKTSGMVQSLTDITDQIKGSRKLEQKISEHKQAEKALRESEEKYLAMAERTGQMVYDYDILTGEIEWSGAIEEISGFTNEEFQNFNIDKWENLIHEDDREHALSLLEKAMKKSSLYLVEYKFRRKDGSFIYVEDSGGFLKDETDEPYRMLGNMKDISDRKQTEKELQYLRSSLSNIINSMPSVLIGIDTDGKVTQWNKTAEQVTGITVANAVAKSLYDVFPQMALEMKTITESIGTQEVRQIRKRLRITENGICYENVTIYPLIADSMEGAVIRIDDVSEQVRLEEMMVQNEKMLSIGGLAAGLAHEINNPLGGMIQTANVMSNRLTKYDIQANINAAEKAGTTMSAIKAFLTDRGIPRMISTINESGYRISEVVENMLNFVRKSEVRRSLHDIEKLFNKTLELAGTDYDLKKQYDFKKIEIRKEYEKNLPPVPCERVKIQQVLLNLFRNGAQAMQESGIEKPLFIIRVRFEKEIKMVCIEIEDNGPGMPEEIRKRIFEPFFTTKPVGVGTGLGLSVSYFIITENHNGEMSVESRPGYGSKFIIRLPVNDRGVENMT